MQEEIIKLNGVPSKLLSFGGVLPSSLEKESVKSRPERLIFMIPGYPGNAEFYARLGNEIYKRTETPVWIAAYAGASYGLRVPNAADRSQYGVDAQIELMRHIIRHYLEGVEIVIIAHSMGCLLTLHVLEDEKCNARVRNALLMTPALERIRYFYLGWISEKFLHLASFLPRKWLRWASPVINWAAPKMGILQDNSKYSPENVIDVNNIVPGLNLGIDIFSKIGEGRTNLKLVEKHTKKLKLYYSARDHWFPSSFCDDLKRDFPDVDAEIDQNNLSHDFEFDTCEKATDVIVNIIFGFVPEIKK